MAHPLDGVRLKLTRAEKHLDEIRGILSLFDKGECSFIPKENPNTGESFLFNRVTPQPDLALSGVIGDYLFCLRSALDHLVTQLIIVNGGRVNTSSMFPITSSPEVFKKESRTKNEDLEGSHPSLTH